MDYSGTQDLRKLEEQPKPSFNPSVSMDYSGTRHFFFCVEYFFFVSILLYQWITLEPVMFVGWLQGDLGFNPSVSMDYSGTLRAKAVWTFTRTVSILLYQWITLERYYYLNVRGHPTKVSILLYQWITLEPNFFKSAIVQSDKFQSFCINGLLWNKKANPCKRRTKNVSILLYQWITLERRKI